MAERRRHLIAGTAIGIAAAALVLSVSTAIDVIAGPEGNPLHTIELKTYDWRLTQTAQPASARPDIALVEIDEYSLRNLEPNVGRWPWPRLLHGMLIDFLARGGARVIVYDVVFAGPDQQQRFEIGGSVWTGESSDRKLVESVKAAGTVILPVDATFEGQASGASEVVQDAGFSFDASRIIERRAVAPPFGDLAGAAAGLAHSLTVLDADGPLRHTVPFVKTGGGIVVPSLGVLAAMRAGSIRVQDVAMADGQLRIADRRIPLQERRTRNADREETYIWNLVNYRGPAFLEDLERRPYQSYKAFDLLQAENNLLNGQPAAIDPAVFKDKVVVVGISATGLTDSFETPFAQGRMPGAQVHASVIDDILSNRFIGPASAGVRWTTVLGLALVTGLLAASLPAWWAIAGTLVLVLSFAGLSLPLFARGLWLNLLQPTLASAAALLGGVSYQYFVEGRERRKVQRLFGRYVSKDVFAQLVANPEMARLGGQRREMTVLFSDIRGFTTLTERGQPEEVVSMLNEYFSKMVEIVFAHRGTIDKFVGDMVMALFNAPLDDPEHADHAVQAALEMEAELQRLNGKWKSEGRFAELDIGVGINTGAMIAGNIGSDAIMSYTVIGDAVNLGARLESLNKQYGTRIIISEATRQRLAGRYRFTPLGDVVVKGKSQPVAIFEVLPSEPS